MRLKTPYYYWGNMRTCKGSMLYIAIAILNKNKSATITFGLEVTLPPIWKLSKIHKLWYGLPLLESLYIKQEFKAILNPIPCSGGNLQKVLTFKEEISE